ncbi:hypothetical protein GGS23DRAFT_617721 [Durotheca rogersii]|uniref:uncharacterized protein n=1 Tax=Durotheca rogersii TaxID=419775 RepID=UPI00221F707D|nr:uncharacterized protein GGS23DRAFT_617721 [Durotheca rogersii]KAI5856685.1 hypothetical protein GGS23DRAFT_617721 [Durotheca rogersii]
MAGTRAQLAAAQKERQSSAPKEQGTCLLKRRRGRQLTTLGTKRPVYVCEHDRNLLPPKRLRTSPEHSVGHTSGRFAIGNICANEPTDPIDLWAMEGRWPREFFELGLEHILAEKRSFLSPTRTRSNSATSMTPSDQKPREEKSAPYQDPRYETLLGTKGSFLDTSELDVTDTSKLPEGIYFDDTIFVDACRNLRGKNKARVNQDISRLIVPSAEILALHNEDLKYLIKSPDYSVGFKRGAFTDDQLVKLSPLIGDFAAGDRSLFMATYCMCFPFLTCEVKYGAATLGVADYQNAYPMTLTVRVVAELFRAVKRESEVNRRILAFSISQDNRLVQIYGHYPTAYRFIKNVYKIWMPAYFEKIYSAIDQSPSNLDSVVPSLLETRLSLGLENVIQSEVADSAALDEDSRSNAAPQGATPDTSFTELGRAKRRKGAKK